ncbi:DUF6510 family protein [Agromyces atrinae]|uniref:DUF6510 family protein n=1 Tax=Agromyces atrinae TaxID=592376 RepID=UPI001F5ADA58|nr:DUF6510 family protein [Agromyces atrinae]MCI2956895.1 DUF6510 family protein [Agromyces atrinae]
MTRLDGNALAGDLADLFHVDLTTALARCAGCGHAGEIATAVVYASPMGRVMRCSTCDDVLGVFVSADGRTWFGLPGVSSIELSTESP